MGGDLYILLFDLMACACAKLHASDKLFTCQREALSYTEVNALRKERLSNLIARAAIARRRECDWLQEILRLKRDGPRLP